MRQPFPLERVLGPKGPGMAAAMRAGMRFLDLQDDSQLLHRVGDTIDAVPSFEAIDKSALQDSYGGNQKSPLDDFLVGRGLFYLTEQRKLYLDCTSGHYQMLWGYNHPALCAAIAAATRAGIIWDNHSNIPQAPVKHLSHRLVALANPPGEKDPIDTVLLGVCTGSVACGAALKILLKIFERHHGARTTPVIIVLGGNYHGTDMVPQFLRGMWRKLILNLEVVSLEPNDPEALESVFRQLGSRVAGFWAEPIMMNREATAVDPAYLQLARRWCDQVGALMCIDEIQTGFWQPEIFAYRTMGITPDLVIAGKGMTAGFHPLSAVLYRHRYDVLEQYDAISTNGSAAMPSFVALCSLEMIAAQARRIAAIGNRIMAGFEALVAEFPDCLQAAHGRAHLAGLKFRRVEEALAFQRRLLEAGLWTRVHAYHEGHRTLLTKLGLLADEQIVDFMIGKFRKLLQVIPKKGSGQRPRPRLGGPSIRPAARRAQRHRKS
ncbi:MAG: aminotransferase class III-fold pyridoxal phosphate-dependent enzyme [Verrucomicrobiota bacterium]